VPRGRSGKRPVLVVAGLVGLVAVILAVTAIVAGVPPWLAGRSPSPEGKVPLPRPDGVPIAYHVVYRVTTGSVVSTEELWVHRPFEAEDLTFSGTAGQGQPLSSIVTRLGRQLVRAGGTPGVFEPSPAPASFDVRLDAVATSAISTRALVALGDRVVAGRDCRVYRSARSLSSTTLAGAPTAADHVDSCVDSQGVLLEERRVVKGKLVQERRAVTVGVGAGVSHSYVTTGTHIPFNQGGGTVVTISDSSRPPGSPFWELPRPPAGFAHLGRFAVVPPQPGAAQGPSKAALVTAIDDVFVHGADAVIVEQGQTVGAAPFRPPAEGTDVETGRLGRGRLVLSATASSVTLLTNRSSFVRVSGTVPPQQLTEVASSLVQQPPGTIVTVPDLTSDGA